MREAVCGGGGRGGRHAPPRADELDAALAIVAERFVKGQPVAAQAFAALLCETSALRLLFEALLMPRHAWHGPLLVFERAAQEACARGGAAPDG